MLTNGANNKFSKAPEGAKTPALQNFQEVGDSFISATLQGRPSGSVGRVCDPYTYIYKYLAAVAHGSSHHPSSSHNLIVYFLFQFYAAHCWIAFCVLSNLFIYYFTIIYYFCIPFSLCFTTVA